MLRSSHVSGLETRPSPQTTTRWQRAPGSGQTNSGSTMAQSALQPSLAVALPSSQASAVWSAPSPQTAGAPAFVGRLQQLIELAVSQELLAALSLVTEVLHHPQLEIVDSER